MTMRSIMSHRQAEGEDVIGINMIVQGSDVSSSSLHFESAILISYLSNSFALSSKIRRVCLLYCLSLMFGG